MRPMPSPAPIVAVDPVLDRADETAVRTLCTTFGRYRTYGELEPIEIPEGPGLAQRHDSVRNFLRSGGLGGARESVGTLAARTSYFREEYAYAGELLHAPRSRRSCTRSASPRPPAPSTADR